MREEIKKTTKLEWTKPEMVKSAIGGVTKTNLASPGDAVTCDS